MLKNIKSFYITKIIFSHVEEESKLKLIKYNKRFQKIMDINIMNYKCFKGNYIKYESKIFGKEYKGCNDQLIFEGEYLNGERNGKGIEYYINGDKLFEGGYLNGKRHGEGKEYYFFGGFAFRGEYLNGLKWKGKRTEYYENGKVKSIHEYLYGKGNHGKAYEYHINGKLQFEGEYLNNKQIIGTSYYCDGQIEYKLKFINGKIEKYNKNIYQIYIL